jgi:DNA-binding response OmpR family regulator
MSVALPKEKAGSGPTADFDAPLVLVADDEPLLLELVSHRLEMDGYRVVTAADGGEALRLAAELRPDLIVLDNLMPVADGLEVLRRLRSDEALAAIPVLMLTGVRTDEPVVTAFKLGAMDFLTKPFLPDELAARVKRLAPMRARDVA